MFRKSEPEHRLLNLAHALEHQAAHLRPRVEHRDTRDAKDVAVVVLEAMPSPPRELLIVWHRREWRSCWLIDGQSSLGFQPMAGAEGDPEIDTVCDAALSFVLGTYDGIVDDLAEDEGVIAEALTRRRTLEVALGWAPTLTKRRESESPALDTEPELPDPAPSEATPEPTLPRGDQAPSPGTQDQRRHWGRVGAERAWFETWLAANGLPELDDLKPPTESDLELSNEIWYDEHGRRHRVFGPAYRDTEGYYEEWLRDGEHPLPMGDYAVEPSITDDDAHDLLLRATSAYDRAWLALVLLNNASPHLSDEMRRILLLLAVNPSPPEVEPLDWGDDLDEPPWP